MIQLWHSHSFSFTFSFSLTVTVTTSSIYGVSIKRKKCTALPAQKIHLRQKHTTPTPAPPIRYTIIFHGEQERKKRAWMQKDRRTTTIDIVNYPKQNHDHQGGQTSAANLRFFLAVTFVTWNKMHS
mmetsp:Transcript_46134/g.112782  ORF Transcript_46134/g.112782 Transcript_46134/m.112782 type:complete len:126 (-) Transcript_46134:252-629(-)